MLKSSAHMKNITPAILLLIALVIIGACFCDKDPTAGAAVHVQHPVEEENRTADKAGSDEDTADVLPKMAFSIPAPPIIVEAESVKGPATFVPNSSVVPALHRPKTPSTLLSADPTGSTLSDLIGPSAMNSTMTTLQFHDFFMQMGLLSDVPIMNDRDMADLLAVLNSRPPTEQTRFTVSAEVSFSIHGSHSGGSSPKGSEKELNSVALRSRMSDTEFTTNVNMVVGLLETTPYDEFKVKFGTKSVTNKKPRKAAFLSNFFKNLTERVIGWTFRLKAQENEIICTRNDTIPQISLFITTHPNGSPSGRSSPSLTAFLPYMSGDGPSPLAAKVVSQPPLDDTRKTGKSTGGDDDGVHKSKSSW